MTHVVLAASGDAVEFMFLIIVGIIILISHLIKKATDAAKRQQRTSGDSQPQSTPWQDVKRFLNEAGVKTPTRPPPPQQRQMHRPAPTVRPAPSRTRQPSAPRPTLRPAPRPAMRQAPRPSPPPPPPAPQRMAAPQKPPKPKAAPAPPAREPGEPRRKAPAAGIPVSVLSLKDMKPSQLRNAIVLREIFGPPVAARGTGPQHSFLP